jgi:hypothetical protein
VEEYAIEENGSDMMMEDSYWHWVNQKEMMVPRNERHLAFGQRGGKHKRQERMNRNKNEIKIK